MIPKSLKIWFAIHFIVDYLFAIPLFFFPIYFLNKIGWQPIDPIFARIIAAALFAIGGVSLVYRNSGSEVFGALLTFKIIWSLAVILGLIIALFSDAPPFTWVVLVLFTIFSAVWIYFKVKLK